MGVVCSLMGAVCLFHHSGPKKVQGDVQQLVIKSMITKKMLFQADGKEVVVGTNKLRITGTPLPNSSQLPLYPPSPCTQLIIGTPLPSTPLYPTHQDSLYYLFYSTVA